MVIWEMMQPLLSMQPMFIVFLPSGGALGQSNTGQPA